MAMKFVMRITFLLLLAVAYGLVGAPPMEKPNCLDSCGKVSIPYPFGIRSTCFMHQLFAIFCNKSGIIATRDGHTHWVMDIQPYPIQMFQVILGSS